MVNFEQVIITCFFNFFFLVYEKKNLCNAFILEYIFFEIEIVV